MAAGFLMFLLGRKGCSAVLGVVTVCGPCRVLLLWCCFGTRSSGHVTGGATVACWCVTSEADAYPCSPELVWQLVAVPGPHAAPRHRQGCQDIQAPQVHAVAVQGPP